MHMSKHCKHRNDRRKSKTFTEPHKLSKGHGTRSGRVDTMGRNYGMREKIHGPRLEHFGGNFARKARDVLTDDVTDYAQRRRRRHDDDCMFGCECFGDDAALVYDASGYGYAGEPKYSLFDEIMASPVKETRRKRRAKEFVREVAHVAPALDVGGDANNDEVSDILSHVGIDYTDGDIAWAEHESSEACDSSLEDFSGDSDSMDEYDDCWDAYEEEDREWIDVCSEEEQELYYDGDPFPVT